MGIFSKLFGGGAPAAATAVVQAASGISDIVERWAPSDASKAQMTLDMQQAIAANVAAARAYDPRTTSANLLDQHFNVLVDGVSRLIRPGITVMIVGGVFGWWPMQTSTIDPLVLSWGETVIGFWFGLRTVTRDIPSLIKMLVELKRGGDSK